MDAAESVLRAGYKLDRYELLCPIASGGMATVWLARLRGKRGFEKLFAVKTIRTELVDDPRFQEMFLDEARIASGIQHPNVAQILDLGEQEDVLFIVMEWVDGDSLAKIRKLLGKRGARLPLGLALRVLADACAGLHAAHEMRDDKGEALEIVHRDVSPQNILVSTSGAVKVIDFGIAKAHGRKQGETRTGVVKGKIQYMAPEQVKKGRTVDRRADVWALGVCLHELVTGKLPYEGDDDVEVIRKLMTDEPPPEAQDVPEPIARVLERAVSIDVETRYATAAAMQRALDAAMKELGESATSEDVAAFLRAQLPELAQKRRDVVGRAVEEARERGTPVTEARESGTSRVATRGGVEVDVAFAPTVMSEREPTIALRKRKDATSSSALQAPARTPVPAPAPAPAAARARPPVAAYDEEPLVIPKKSRAWLWVLLLLVGGGAGAVYLFPDQARRLAGTLGLGGEPAPAPTASAEGTSTVPSATEPAPSTPSIATGIAPPALSASAAVAAPTASSQHPAPEPSASHRGWHDLVPPPPLAAPALPPGARASAPQPAPASSLPPGPAPSAAPAPSASDDDPGNPY